jgi:hypothetical protein
MMLLARGLLLLQEAVVVLLEVAQGHPAVQAAAALLLSVGQPLAPAATRQQHVLTAFPRVHWC